MLKYGYKSIIFLKNRHIIKHKCTIELINQKYSTNINQCVLKANNLLSSVGKPNKIENTAGECYGINDQNMFPYVNKEESNRLSKVFSVMIFTIPEGKIRLLHYSSQIP